MGAAAVAPVIIKRKKVSGGDGHHGGAWKVAIGAFPYDRWRVLRQVFGKAAERRLISHSDVCRTSRPVLCTMGNLGCWLLTEDESGTRNCRAFYSNPTHGVRAARFCLPPRLACRLCDRCQAACARGRYLLCGRSPFERRGSPTTRAADCG
jgi:hypothetical protein